MHPPPSKTHARAQTQTETETETQTHAGSQEIACLDKQTHTRKVR